MSTNYKNSLSINNLTTTVVKNNEEILDVLDPRLQNVINEIKSTQPYTYNGIEPFTTISQHFYGTTTLWKFLIYFNGFFDPLEIEPGTLIFIPDITEIEDLFKKYSIPSRENIIKI